MLTQEICLKQVKEYKKAKGARLLIRRSFSLSVHQPLVFPSWEEAPQPILLASVNMVSVIGNSVNDLELSDMFSSHQTF